MSTSTKATMTTLHPWARLRTVARDMRLSRCDPLRKHEPAGRSDYSMRRSTFLLVVAILGATLSVASTFSCNGISSGRRASSSPASVSAIPPPQSRTCSIQNRPFSSGPFGICPVQRAEVSGNTGGYVVTIFTSDPPYVYVPSPAPSPNVHAEVILCALPLGNR